MKKIFTLFLAITFFASSVYAQTNFSDDGMIRQYSRKYVEMLVSEGGIHGYTDNTFKPQGTVTRAEFMSMCFNSFYKGDLTDYIANVIGEEKYSETVYENGFDKVWNGAADNILAVAAYMELSDKFKGEEWNEPITRAEAARMLYRSLLKFKDENIESTEYNGIINDWNIISKTEYAEDIGALFSLGIIQGDANGNFEPDRSLTREDGAILICKALHSELREVKKVSDTYVLPSGERGVRTIKNFIATAFEPVGKVMYVYGGGWNEADDGAGTEAMTLGLSQSWLDFAKDKTASYNCNDYDYTKDVSVIHDGLDCSGYVGWAIYNVLNDGKGYVTNSYKMDDMLQAMGYGSIVERKDVSEVKAGDIMASNCDDCKHVFISLGKCSDGSMLLLHSSPPGVQLSGTYTPDGNKNSEAIKLASEYMKKYYPDWYNKFPDNSRNASYLTHYNRFVWSALSDDEGIRDMSPREILEVMFNE